MTAILAVLYALAITLIGAFLFTAVDWLEPNRRLAIAFKCAILAAGAAAIANHRPASGKCSGGRVRPNKHQTNNLANNKYWSRNAERFDRTKPATLPSIVLALTTATPMENVAMASPSYRELMKAQRAEARAKRDAEKAEWHRGATLAAEVRRLSLEAGNASVRDSGDRVTLYTPAQLRVMADAVIGPWLVARAKTRIAELLRPL
jgi:hypothetical protein